MLKSYGFTNLPQAATIFSAYTQGNKDITPILADIDKDLDFMFNQPPLTLGGKAVNFAPIQWDAVKKYFGERAANKVKQAYEEEVSSVRIKPEFQTKWEIIQKELEDSYNAAQTVSAFAEKRIVELHKELEEVEAMDQELEFAYVDHIATLEPQVRDEALYKFYEMKVSAEEADASLPSSFDALDNFQGALDLTEINSHKPKQFDASTFSNFGNQVSKSVIDQIVAEEEARLFTIKDHH